MTRSASRAFAAAALSALCLPALPALDFADRWQPGRAWGATGVLGAVVLGALPALLSALWVAELAPRPVARAARLVYDVAAAVLLGVGRALAEVLVLTILDAHAGVDYAGLMAAAAVCLAAHRLYARER